jgi:hypothetical protein
MTKCKEIVDLRKRVEELETKLALKLKTPESMWVYECPPNSKQVVSVQSLRSIMHFLEADYGLQIPEIEKKNIPYVTLEGLNRLIQNWPLAFQIQLWRRVLGHSGDFSRTEHLDQAILFLEGCNLIKEIQNHQATLSDIEYAADSRLSEYVRILRGYLDNVYAYKNDAYVGHVIYSELQNSSSSFKFKPDVYRKIYFINLLTLNQTTYATYFTAMDDMVAINKYIALVIYCYQLNKTPTTKELVDWFNAQGERVK